MNSPESLPEQRPPMVYIVTQQPFDYTPASQYGTLYFMKAAKLAPSMVGDGGAFNQGVLHKIRQDLQEYRPGVDFIVPTGSPAGLLIVGMILGQTGQTHKLLQWDAFQQKYNQINITV